MGIVDDYYGGYENLAMFIDEDGCIDYEAAYDSQLPDDDGYYDPTLEGWQRGMRYKIKEIMRQDQQRELLPGWHDTGRTTHHGKPIYEGHCSSCNVQCTVPFAPRSGGNPPKCKQCLAATARGAGSSRNARRGRRRNNQQQQQQQQQPQQAHQPEQAV